MSDALTRCLALAPLLWPNTSAFDVRLSRGTDGINALLLAGGDCVSVAVADDGVAALDALAATLAAAAHDRSDDLLRAAGTPLPDAPSPAPSRDELAARLAEAERQLADVTRRADFANEALSRLRGTVGSFSCGDTRIDFVLGSYVGDATIADLRRLAATLAARVDHEPPQRAPGLVAGVSDRLRALVNAALRRDRYVDHGDLLTLADDLDATEARQRAGGGEGRGELAQQQEQGAAGGGVVAEAAVRRVVREYRGRSVGVFVEVLRGEGGSVHGDSVAPATSTGKAQP